MSRKQKMVIAILAIMIVIGILVACDIDTAHMYEQERIERVNCMVELVEKNIYSQGMQFEFQIYSNGERRVVNARAVFRRFDSGSIHYDPTLSDPVFVYSEEDAANFPENVVVGWPRGGIFKEVFIAGIHEKVDMTEDQLMENTGVWHRPVITLEQFGLTYPLTHADFVDNWEKVFELWMTLDDHEARRIQVNAWEADYIAFPNITRPEKPPDDDASDE